MKPDQLILQNLLKNRDEIKQYARGVFTGEIPPDRDYEAILINRNKNYLKSTQKIKFEDSLIQNIFQQVYDDLSYIVDNWIEPKLSVSPAARNKLNLTEEELKNIKERIDNLPKLDFNEELEKLIEESKKYDSCMLFSVNEQDHSVDLYLDTHTNSYAEWIAGERSDICLFRDRNSNKVVGVRLPLKNNRLAVNYDGPLKINEGFLKNE